MQPRKDSKSVSVSKKDGTKTQDGGFFDSIFGSKKTEEPPKASSAASAATAPIKLNDQKRTTQNSDIDLSLLFIRTSEINTLVEKALTEEKNSAFTTFKTFFGSKKASDEDTPLGRLKRFNKDISRSKAVQLSPVNVWELLQLAMDPEIAENSEDHKLYQNAIGYKLDMLANQSDFLVKLRWCNNYFPITGAKFSTYCRLAKSANSQSDIEEFISLKPRKSPLVLGVKDTMKEIAADLSKAADDAWKDTSKAVKESTSVSNFI